MHDGILQFTVVTKLIKNFKSLYGFGGRCLKIRDVCMDFENHFKVHNLASVHPKSIILGQMINVDKIFHVVVSVYRLVEIWNSPQFPAEFRNRRAYLKLLNGSMKNFKSLYGLGGRSLKIRDVCMDFEPYFKAHNLVSIHPKSIILGQLTNLNMVFRMVVSVYWLVKILKLAPVPWWISEWLIVFSSSHLSHLET